MKLGYYIFLGLAFLTVTGVSCKKNTSVDANTALAGTWELRDVSGGMLAGSTKYVAGNGNTLHFDGSNYEMHTSGQPVKSGQYIVVTDTTIGDNVCLVFPKGQFTNRIIYDNDTTATKHFFEVNGNQLVLYYGCYALDNGHRLVYERIGEKGN